MYVDGSPTTSLLTPEKLLLDTTELTIWWFRCDLMYHCLSRSIYAVNSIIHNWIFKRWTQIHNSFIVWYGISHTLHTDKGKTPDLFDVCKMWRPTFYIWPSRWNSSLFILWTHAFFHWNGMSTTDERYLKIHMGLVIIWQKYPITQKCVRSYIWTQNNPSYSKTRPALHEIDILVC